MRAGGRLPTFLVVGAMKAGTTSLYNHLRAHPDVFMTPYKEPEFFCAEKNWDRGADWYARLFAGAGDVAAVGEASTAYSKPGEFPGVPRRIAAVVPEVRMVYVLREPVERIRSMYEHMVLTGRERRPIDVAVLDDPRYLDASRYGTTVRGYLDCFPREQLHLLLTDDLLQDATGALRGVTDFLGLPPHAEGTLQERTDLRTGDRRPDRRLKTLLRDSPAAYRAAARLPAPLLETLRTLTSRPTSGPRPQLADTTREELTQRLLPDLDELRRVMGPAFPAWGLLPPVG